jgi:hypothetical protein
MEDRNASTINETLDPGVGYLLPTCCLFTHPELLRLLVNLAFS